MSEQRATPSIVDRIVWRDAGVIWLCQHILLVVLTYVGRGLFAIPSYSTQPLPWATMFTPWMAWDGAHFADVATYGYANVADASYYPLFPLLEHLLSPLTGNMPALSGVLIANAASLGAFGLFRVLCEREFGRETAQRALLYLAIFPTAFFLAAPYTESLFLLFSVAAFLAIRQGNWLVAGVLVALATLTRAVGILLLLPMAIEGIMLLRQHPGFGMLRQRLALLGGLLLPLIAVAGFWFYLYLQLGIISPSAGERATDWQRELTWPFIGFARSGAALIQNGIDPTFHQVHILLDMAFTLLFIALTIATWRRLPLSYVVYAGATLTAILLVPSHNWYALGSNMRFMLVSFPIFMLLGIWGRLQMVERLILSCSLPLLALFTVAFLQTWIA